MIVALLLMVLLQDGPVRTAPAAEPAQDGAATPADPGPRCTFGGRPVHSPGCPTPEGRIAFVTPTEQPPTAEEDDANPWDAVNRFASERATVGEGGYGRNAAAAAAPESGVPAWALTDPARWETNQCGASGDEACRRQARNRLAMARAGVAAEPPASGGASGGGQNCRMVMRRSESGFGGSLSRVCGDEAAVEDLLGRLDVPAQPRAEPCDRPANLESQDAWIARCRGLPAR